MCCGEGRGRCPTWREGDAEPGGGASRDDAPRDLGVAEDPYMPEPPIYGPIGDGLPNYTAHDVEAARERFLALLENVKELEKAL